MRGCRRGFTIVEVMVVLLMIAILTAVAAPAILPRGTREDNRMARTLKEARTESIRSGRPVQVLLIAADGSVSDAVAFPDGSVITDAILRIDPRTGRLHADE
jgi:prepilin-type N-terminal cleavage/methylation domain-containing protein